MEARARSGRLRSSCCPWGRRRGSPARRRWNASGTAWGRWRSRPASCRRSTVGHILRPSLP
eukprot:3201115-Alexandrium_andersonii.AAC.1